MDNGGFEVMGFRGFKRLSRSLLGIGGLSTAVPVVKHHHRKQDGEEGVYVAYALVSLFITEGSQSRNSNQGRILEAGAGAEAMEGCCLLPCSVDSF